MARMDTKTAVVGVLLTVATMVAVSEGASSWCIARSGASQTALQVALDYACGEGADCVPIQADGLCYLPNTVQSHASYAFNSYYQLSNLSPGSCDFGGTATITVTDPSFGSCTYPSSPSNAGRVKPTPTITTPVTNSPTTNLPPSTTTVPPSLGGGSGVGGGLTPGFGPATPDTSYAAAAAAQTPLRLLLCAITLYLTAGHSCRCLISLY